VVDRVIYLNLVGRAVLCAPPPANPRFLVHHDGGHGVTRPAFPVF